MINNIKVALQLMGPLTVIFLGCTMLVITSLIASLFGVL